jgi:CcmD family protein
VLICLLVSLLVSGAVAEPQAQETRRPRSEALPPELPGPLYFPDRMPRLGPENGRVTPDGRMLRIRQQLPTTPDDEFTPISELPPDERLPAAPMLVGAYAFVALAIFAYLVSLSRRLQGVAREIARLEAQIKRP